MTLHSPDLDLNVPNPEDRTAILEARLRRAQEALADQVISRRLDRDRIAILELEAQDLRETIASLRRALDAARPAQELDCHRRHGR